MQTMYVINIERRNKTVVEGGLQSQDLLEDVL